nr:P150 [Ruhugu virus]
MEKLIEETLVPGGPFNLSVGGWVRDKVRTIVENVWEVRDVVTTTQKRAISLVIPRPAFTQTQVSDHPALHAISRYTTSKWIEWGRAEDLHVLLDPSPRLLRIADKGGHRWVALCLDRSAHKLLTARVESAGDKWHADYVSALSGRASGKFYTHASDVPQGGRLVADRTLLGLTPRQCEKMMLAAGINLGVAVTLWPTALSHHEVEMWDDLELTWRYERDSQCPLTCGGYGVGRAPGAVRPCTTRIICVNATSSHPGKLYTCAPKHWVRECCNGRLYWEVATEVGHQARIRMLLGGAPVQQVRRLGASARVRLPDLIHLAETGKWRWFSLPRAVFQRMLSYCKTLSPDAYYSERVFKFKNALSHSITLAGQLLQEGWKGSCAEEDALCAYVAFRAWQSNARLADIMRAAKGSAGSKLTVAGWLTWLWDAIKRFFGRVPLPEKMEKWESEERYVIRERPGEVEPPPPTLSDGKLPSLAMPTAGWLAPVVDQQPHCACSRYDIDPAPEQHVESDEGPLVPAWLFSKAPRKLRVRTWDWEALRVRAEEPALPAPHLPRMRARDPPTVARLPPGGSAWVTLAEPTTCARWICLCWESGEPVRPLETAVAGRGPMNRACGVQGCSFVRLYVPSERRWDEGGYQNWNNLARRCASVARQLGGATVVHLPPSDGRAEDLLSLMLRVAAYENAPLAVSLCDRLASDLTESDRERAAALVSQYAPSSQIDTKPVTAARDASLTKAQESASALAADPPLAPPLPSKYSAFAHPLTEGEITPTQPPAGARDVNDVIDSAPPIAPAPSITSVHAVGPGAEVTGEVGDILSLRGAANAVVNAANAELRRGDGVCGAIFAAASAALLQDCAKLSPCPAGGCVVTFGHGCGYDHIIHAVAPDRRAGEDYSKLKVAYAAVIAAAQRRRWGKVACPLLGAGIYGWTPSESWHACAQAVQESTVGTVRVRLVLLHPDAAVMRSLSAPEATGADACMGCELCDRPVHRAERGYVNLWNTRDRGTTAWAMRVPEVVVYGPRSLAHAFPLNHYSALRPRESGNAPGWRRPGWGAPQSVACEPTAANAAYALTGCPPRVSTRGGARDANSCWLRAAAAICQCARMLGAFAGNDCTHCGYGRRLSAARSSSDFAALQQSWIASHADADGAGRGDPLEPLSECASCDCSRLWLGSAADAPTCKLLLSLGSTPRGSWRAILRVRAVPEGGEQAGHFVVEHADTDPEGAGVTHLTLALPRVRGG